MQIYNALQLKNGAKVEKNKMGSFTQPVQFLSKKEKDQAWASWNLDWLELRGQEQLRRNAKRFLKNYKLAKGIIDKNDYIVEDQNDYSELIDVLTQEDTSALELKFYPIIPNVINVLTSEFSKRSTKVSYRAVDEFTYNEQLEQKRSEVESVLVQQAQMKMMMKLEEMGLDLNSEEAQQKLSPENLKTLPELERFFKKDYRSIPEEWAWHQHTVDVERFKIHELEEMGFRDSLITDRTFFHYRMLEDDYDIELWNPVTTFYNKSPNTRYISEGNYVGKIDLLSIADVVDKYGYLMTEEQLNSLESIYPIKSAGYAIAGTQNDGSFYDASRSHAWNVNPPSLGYRQFNSVYDYYPSGDVVRMILQESEDLQDMGGTFLLRATTCYWKTQKKVGHLVKIDINGNVMEQVIDEDYIVTDKPIYDDLIYKEKTKENLVFGEHIDWIWINETWGGVKIGPNRPSNWGSEDHNGLTPIYLGITSNRVKKLKFQFKGDDSLYGCKLPVEGAVFSDRNTKSTSLVDLMKPFQIAYNIVNNQIADILVDELGTVILLDQNAIPRHSLGEDWGKHNLSKAYVAMKNFQMLPLDTSLTNTENPIAFQHYQVLNLEQTQRLLSRVELAKYFKEQALETIGITPQRMGTAIEQPTAEGIRVSLTNSYAQTETYFTQFCDNLMPRVHTMRTDLAQYYQSTKPSVRLQYMTGADEKINFSINGTDLLLRDINVFCTTKANHRVIMDQLKQLVMTNNTAGASIYDLGNVLKSESIPELDVALKSAEEKQNSIRQQEMQHEQEMLQQQLEAKDREIKEQRAFEAEQNQLDRETDLLEREIQASGYGAMQDINQNQQSDYMDAMDRIRASEEYQGKMSMDREKENNKNIWEREKLNIKREELNMKKYVADKSLQVARENKNQSDITARKKEKERKAKQKK